MTTWAVVFLGVIAVATAITAVLQIGLILTAVRLVRRITALVDRAEGDLQQLLASANAVGRDAARAASLVREHVERADRVLVDLAARVGETVASVQETVTRPARNGGAFFVGLRAALAVLRGFWDLKEEKRSDDEDSLFI